MFDDNFINELGEDNIEAALMVCKRYFEVHKSLGGIKKQKAHIEVYCESLAFAEIFIDARKINYVPVPQVDLTIPDAEEHAIKRIFEFFTDWQKESERLLHSKSIEKSFEDAKERFSAMLGKTIVYEFSNEEYAAVQCLLKGLIATLSNSSGFDMEYKNRLLNKFRRLQEKLKPNMCHFDGLWGMVVDIWIAAGKSSSAAKPLAKKAQDVIEIIWYEYFHF